MAFTQTQYDTLQNAIAQGALEVRYGDKKVVYRSLDEMLRILNVMGVSLGILQANAGRKVASYHNGIKPGCSDDIRWIP